MSEREKTITQADRWEEMFRRLLAFREKHGNCHVPTHYDEDPRLGKWVAAQRQQHRTSASNTSHRWKEREARLEEVGFEWIASNPRCVKWEARFCQLCAFVVKNGHSQVPIAWEENVKLANWVSAQRQDFHSIQMGRAPTRLNQERISLLNSIGFVWKAQRGGLKRPRQCSQVPAPQSLDPSTKSSDDYQARARYLLEVLGSNSSSQLETAQEQGKSASAKSRDLDQEEEACGSESERKKRAIEASRSKDVRTPVNQGTLPTMTGFKTEPTITNRVGPVLTAPESSQAANESSVVQESVRRLLESTAPTAHSQLQTNRLQALLTNTTFQPLQMPLTYVSFVPTFVPTTTSELFRRQRVQLPAHLLLNNRHILSTGIPQGPVNINPLTLASQTQVTLPSASSNGQQSVGISILSQPGTKDGDSVKE